MAKKFVDAASIRDRLARAQQEHADAKAAIKAAERQRDEALRDAQGLMGMDRLPTVQEVEKSAQEAQAQEKSARYNQSVQGAISNMKAKADELLQADPAEHSALMEFAARFEPVIGLAPGVRPGPLNTLGDEILASPEPVEVLRYLRDNPDTLQRIATLRTSREVAREVAKIEARIEARSQAEAAAPAGTAPRPVSQAPRPVRPVTGGRTAADSSEPDDSMSDAEYFRRRMSQGFKRGRR